MRSVARHVLHLVWCGSHLKQSASGRTVARDIDAKARRYAAMFSQRIALAVRRRTLSSLLDGAFAYLSRLHLIGTTKTTYRWAKTRERLTTRSARLVNPPPRLWSGDHFRLRLLRLPNDYLRWIAKDIVPVAALDGRAKPRKRDAELSRK